LRSADGALTVMVINKDAAAVRTLNLQLANFSGASAQRWQLTSANRIQPLSSITVSGASLVDTAPAQSITLYVIR
jgi:O-glycosyl hydrolase